MPRRVAGSTITPALAFLQKATAHGTRVRHPSWRCCPRPRGCLRNIRVQGDMLGRARCSERVLAPGGGTYRRMLSCPACLPTACPTFSAVLMLTGPNTIPSKASRHRKRRSATTSIQHCMRRCSSKDGHKRCDGRPHFTICQCRRSSDNNNAGGGDVDMVEKISRRAS